MTDLHYPDPVAQKGLLCLASALGSCCQKSLTVEFARHLIDIADGDAIDSQTRELLCQMIQIMTPPESTAPVMLGELFNGTPAPGGIYYENPKLTRGRGIGLTLVTSFPQQSLFE
jgi:hypothetical protein